MALSGALEKLTAAKVKLAIHHPFFSFLVSQIRLIESKTETETLGTDGSRIYYNPDYTNKRSITELIFILCHEILHIINLHPSRRHSRDPKLFNVACDYCVNDILVKSELVPPREVLLDDKYSGMIAEQVYDDLFQNAKKVSANMCCLDDHSLWNKPGRGPAKPGSDEEKRLGPELTPERVREIAVGAYHAAKMIGKVPGGVERMFEEIMRPKINWEQVLYRFVERLEKDDYTYSRYNRRYEPCGVYLPSIREEDGLQLGVGIDVSGSIGAGELTRFVTELIAIARQKIQVKMRFIILDCTIQDEFDLDNSKPISAIVEELRRRVKGGGGTDMSPAIQEFDKRPELAAVIIFTDGFIPPPVKPKRNMKVLWALTHDCDLPYGQKILIEAGDGE